MIGSKNHKRQRTGHALVIASLHEQEQRQKQLKAMIRISNVMDLTRTSIFRNLNFQTRCLRVSLAFFNQLLQHRTVRHGDD